jgi:tetratricopeptide (TPR) repeat protein
MRLALRALELDRRDFRAHWVLGGIYLHDGEHALSIAEFDKALRINPNDANLLAWSAEALTYAGLLGDAVERCDRAMRINPNCPDWYHWVKAFALFHQGRYDMALAELNRMSTPGHAGKLKAAVLALLGDLAKASEEADAFMQILPGFRVAEWALTERYADPAELDRYTDGLRKAGLPE